MHLFTELVDRCVSFSLWKLNELNDLTVEALETSGATSHVKNLQMVQMQKAIMAVGMFSLFESMTQDRFRCEDGFAEITKILDEESEPALKEQFVDFQKAINVLKHGRGRSYDALVAKADSLPFKIRQPDQAFFFEGDVSEIFTLIEVDDNLILECGRVIREVSEILRRRPNGWF